MTTRFLRPLACLLLAATCCPAPAEDWPQWLGPNRDATYAEQDVRTAIPESGLPVRWRVPCATGYSGPAVVDGRVYLFEYEITDGELTFAAGRPDELKGTERVRCLDAQSGEELWSYEYDCPYRVSYGGGPRCTPTVDGGLVYTLGAEGDLSCLKADDGSLRVTVNVAPPAADASTPPPENGLSPGTEPSGMMRAILPCNRFGSCASSI